MNFGVLQSLRITMIENQKDKFITRLTSGLMNATVSNQGESITDSW